MNPAVDTLPSPLRSRARHAALFVGVLGLMSVGLGCDDDNHSLPDGSIRVDASAQDSPMADTAAPDAAAADARSLADAATADRLDAPPADALLPDVTPPDATHDTQPVPGIPVLPHKTDFLNVGCRTHTYGGLNVTQRKACRNAVKQRGYTHFYLYAYNEKDYGGPRFDYFADPQGFASLLQELIDDGLAPVVWLFPDDAPVIHAQSVTDLQNKILGLVPAIDHLVSSYCLGLELDEYWASPKVQQLGNLLRALTSKKIGVHQINGKWNYGAFAWVDYMILQYGFGKNVAFIQQMTRQCISELKKPVVAGEYALDNEGAAATLGNAAVAAGASGFGNGGTP